MLATLEKVHMQQCRPIADKYIYIFISNYAYVMMVINISVTSIEFFLCTKQDTSRDITLMTKVHIVKAMIFSVVLYGCESWTIKKSEHRRNDTFKLVLEKILESPLDNKEIKSVNPKGNQP